MTLAVVRALGWVVIVHGLTHAVLPLRGSLAPGYLMNDWMPVGLYMVAMIGFVVAGLGMLGLRPLDSMISPILVLASGLSLVAIARLGDATLWIGGAFDVPLLFLGLWRSFAGWPTHPYHGRTWHMVGLAFGFAFLGYVAAAVALWPWHRTWGSTREELALSLPGDDPTHHPALSLQHAVTIDAPPQAVWPWLVQLGQDRAGFYSYDWLERAFGADIHNVFEVHPEWQQRRVGDHVPATQPNYLGGLFGSRPGWTVAAVDAPRALVLDQWGAFVLMPTEDGGTRFIIRSTFSRPTYPVWAAGIDFLTFELPHFIMQRRMMLTIKALAEQHQILRASAH